MNKYCCECNSQRLPISTNEFDNKERCLKHHSIFVRKEVSKRNKCEVYSRICGYIRPVEQWNEGKQSEFKDRKTFKIKSQEQEE